MLMPNFTLLSALGATSSVCTFQTSRPSYENVVKKARFPTFVTQGNLGPSPRQQVHGSHGPGAFLDFRRQVALEPCLGAVAELVAARKKIHG